MSETEQEMGAVALAIASQVRTAAITYFDSFEETRSAKEYLDSANEALRYGFLHSVKG